MVYLRAGLTLLAQTTVFSFIFALAKLAWTGQPVAHDELLKVALGYAGGVLVLIAWPVWCVPLGWIFSLPAKLGYRLGRKG